MCTRLRLWSTWFLLLVLMLLVMQPVAAQDQTDPQVGCTPPDGWQQYKVQAGDTLSRLARAYGMKAWQIARGNCLMYQVQVGQVIFLPPVGPHLEAGDPLLQREQLQQRQSDTNLELNQDRDRSQERDRDCSQDCNPDHDHDQNRDRDRSGHK